MTTIKIKGMSCDHCVRAVSRVLNSIEGIKNVKVNLAKGEATFIEEKPVDMELIGQQIKKAGYEVG
jgi:copper chaperone